MVKIENIRTRVLAVLLLSILAFIDIYFLNTYINKTVAYFGPKEGPELSIFYGSQIRPHDWLKLYLGVSFVSYLVIYWMPVRKISVVFMLLSVCAKIAIYWYPYVFIGNG